MNIANITARFAALTGVSGDELFNLSDLIDTAVSYINAHSKVENPDEEQTKRLEMLCAAYAFWLYDMCNDAGVTSFTAGDVKLTSSAGGKSRGQSLWLELQRSGSDLLRGDSFIFGRM